MKYIYLFIFCLTTLTIGAQNSQDVLLTIAGHDVYVVDFLRSYSMNEGANKSSKNEKQRIADYLNNYIDFKLKVIAAEEMGLDKKSDFKDYMTSVSNMSVNDGGGSNVFRSDYPVKKTGVHIADIFLPLGQHSSIGEQRLLQMRMDSINRAVKEGADFNELAMHYSLNRKWHYCINQNETLQEVEKVIFGLAANEVSEPFLSTDGFHLIKRLDDETVFLFSKELEKAVPVVGKKVDTDWLLKEYRDGLLVAKACQSVVDDSQNSDEKALARYFSNHIKQYEWDVPRYKGAVYFCKSKKDCKRVAKVLKKHPQSSWKSISGLSSNKKIFADVKFSAPQMYKLSENPFIDELVFGGPKVKRDETYRYVGVVGRELKKFPEAYTDVKELVEIDYKRYLEDKWVESLHKRFPVVVHDKVLKRISLNNNNK